MSSRIEGIAKELVAAHDAKEHEEIQRLLLELSSSVYRDPGQQERDELIRSAAKSRWEEDGGLEIDEDAIVSDSERGAYVAAWVWVDCEDYGEECPEDEFD